MVALLDWKEQTVLLLTQRYSQVAVRLGWMGQTAEPRTQRCNPVVVRPEKMAHILGEAPRVKRVGTGIPVVDHQDSRVDTQAEDHRETRAGAAPAGNLVVDCLGSMDGNPAVVHQVKKAYTQVAVHLVMRVDNQEGGHQERKVDNLVGACQGWRECVRFLVGPSRILTSSTTCMR